MKPGLHIIAAAVMLAAATAAAGKPAGPVKTTALDVTAHGLRVRATGVSKAAEADVRAVIEEQTALTEDVTMTAPLADDLAFFVRQRYLDLGYVQVKVPWEIEGDAALLQVDEGPPTLVGTITFEGSNGQDVKELTAYLLRRTHEKLKESSDHPPYVEADLRAGAGLVQRYFQGQGFLDAVVEEPVCTHSVPGPCDLRVKIIPGRHYQVGAVHVTGDLLGQEKAIQKQTAQLRDIPFNEVKIEKVRADILGIYQAQGRFSAEVTAQANAAAAKNGTVPVIFHVVPGRQFRITGIEAAPGLSKGAQRLAESGFKRAVNRVYSPAEIDVMHRRVLNSEVFSRLDVKATPTGPDTMTLRIAGEEAMTRRVSVYGGYETFLGPILGLEWRKVNWMDTGDAIRAKAEINGQGFNGDLAWIDPDFLGSSSSLEAGLRAESQKIFDYERQSYRGRLILNRQWDRHISAKLFADVSDNHTRSSLLTPVELGPSDYQIASIGASVVFDYRDSPLLPTRGWYGSLAVTDTVGDVSFVRVDGVLSFYMPITKKFRAAFGTKISGIYNSGGITHVPIDLRVFNGGPNSVRSFRERRMGQKGGTDTPLGGALSEVLNLEFSYSLSSNLELALFGDAGSLSPTAAFPTISFPALRYAVGLGLRYRLPIGPLRIDYGVNPNRRPGEPFGALSVSFGFAF
ncbi:MAG: hypothetical protein JWR15_528 [Prosthecobacter sp.]|nr:hypothetical protein [Prosthecobacter sp.]